MFKQLKAWYLKKFLPFEDPSHPLFSDGGAQCEAKLQEIWDEIDQEDALLNEDEIETLTDLVGPNYARQMGYEPTQYERWGNKYYRKSK